MNIDVATVFVVIWVIITFITLIIMFCKDNVKAKKDQKKSEIHAKDRYSIVDDDEHLGIFMN